MSKKTNRAAGAKLDALYAQLPTIQCRGLCHEACGPILLTVIEADRLRRTAHQTPRTDAGQTCGYLTAARRCAVYAVRPLICRVYGLVKRLSCPFGCVPDRWLSDHDFLDLALAVEAVAGELLITTPDGAHSLGQSFRDLEMAAANMPPAVANHYADLTRGLRALHHGRIMSVAPAQPGEATWTRARTGA